MIIMETRGSFKGERGLQPNLYRTVVLKSNFSRLCWRQKSSSTAEWKIADRAREAGETKCQAKERLKPPCAHIFHGNHAFCHCQHPAFEDTDCIRPSLPYPVPLLLSSLPALTHRLPHPFAPKELQHSNKTVCNCNQCFSVCAVSIL